MIFHSGMQGGLRPHVHSVNTEPFEVNAFKAEINLLFLISRCISSHQMIGFFFFIFHGQFVAGDCCIHNGTELSKVWEMIQWCGRC